MSHVLRLRPDVVKIDMTLVRDVDRDPIRQALVVALVRFAEVAGAQVVAEGVETCAELTTLVDLGVPLAQGYLFGLPSDAPVLHGHVHCDDHGAVVVGTLFVRRRRGRSHDPRRPGACTPGRPEPPQP